MRIFAAITCGWWFVTSMVFHDAGCLIHSTDFNRLTFLTPHICSELYWGLLGVSPSYGHSYRHQLSHQLSDPVGVWQASSAPLCAVVPWCFQSAMVGTRGVKQVRSIPKNWPGNSLGGFCYVKLICLERKKSQIQRNLLECSQKVILVHTWLFIASHVIDVIMYI